MQEIHSPTDPFTVKSLSVSAFPDALLVVNHSGMALPESGPLLVTSGLNMAKSKTARPRQLWGFTKPSKRQLDVKNCGSLLPFVFRIPDDLFLF